MVLAGVVNGTEEAVYRFNLNPLVWWVWFGGFILVTGGLVTMWPGGGPMIRTRRPAQAGYAATLAERNAGRSMEQTGAPAGGD